MVEGILKQLDKSKEYYRYIKLDPEVYKKQYDIKFDDNWVSSFNIESKAILKSSKILSTESYRDIPFSSEEAREDFKRALNNK